MGGFHRAGLEVKHIISPVLWLESRLLITLNYWLGWKITSGCVPRKKKHISEQVAIFPTSSIIKNLRMEFKVHPQSILPCSQTWGSQSMVLQSDRHGLES